MPQVDAAPDFVKVSSRRVVGADVFIETGELPAQIGPALEKLVEGTPLKLKMISNRGTQVYPDRGSLVDCCDQYRCRLVARDAAADITDADIIAAMQKVAARYRWAHIEKLQEFDGAPGYTKAQGED
jgi:isocitrate dehydrogenase